MKMSMLDDLTCDNAKIRLKAVLALDLNRTCPYGILSHVFELLEDDCFVEDDPLGSDVPKKDQVFIEPDEFYAEQAISASSGIYLYEAAQKALLGIKNLPDYFLDLILENMEDINSRGAFWLMRVFFDFPWKDPETAFDRLVPLIFSSKSPNVYNLFENSAFHATSSLLHRIFFEDSSGYYVFQALVRSRADEVRNFFEYQGNQEAFIKLLINVNENVKSEVLWIYLDSLFKLKPDPAVLNFILKQAVKNEVGHASLYLALFDSRYAKAASKELQFLVFSSRDAEIYLSSIISFLLEHTERQKKYPVELFFSCFKSSFWLKNIEKIYSSYLQEQLLKNLYAREKERFYRFQILFQMLMRNLLKNKPELISEFWIDLETEMAGPNPPLEKNHPLVVMAKKNLMPNGYNSFIFKQLKRGTITPSFALSFWTPGDTAPPTVAFLLSVIEREIIRTKEQWETEKRERKANPQRYYYEDRKAPYSVLMLLDEKWKSMLSYLEENNHQRVLQMAHNLLTVSWVEELLAITEHYEKH